MADLQELVDLHLFEGAQVIVQALQQHNCKPALEWCHQHQPRLRKLKSKLEFRLCLQVNSRIKTMFCLADQAVSVQNRQLKTASS